ncbi:MAG: head GIN domain-containing protein [Bacteroidota bacterium]
MKTKIISVVLLLTIVLSGCGFWGIRGNGRVREDTRKIQDFQRLEAGGAFSIRVDVGQEPSLRISAEENLLNFIRTRVKGNTLVVDTRRNISPRKEILIVITTPRLRSIEASGANNIEVKGISETDFRVELSGAGNIDLKGEVDKLRAELSGAGNINAKELIAKEVRISVSGAASADVYAKEYLDASVSGVGSIDYYGNPAKTRTDVSGVGSISRK